MAAKHFVLLSLLLSGLLLVTACGQVRPVPAVLELEQYKPIEYQELQAAGRLLAPGQRVRCRAYFWQFLTYDPAPVYYYFNQIRYPLGWRDLEWFALYGTPAMQDYFDRAAMDETQRQTYQLHRLDPIIIYGELVSLGGRQLYLRVHHVQKEIPH